MISVDTSKANLAITRYVTELGQNAGEVIKREMLLLLQQCIKFTPPKTYTQGRAAIARDIRRAVKQAEPDWITNNIHNPRLRTRLRLAVESQNEVQFEALMKVISPKWQVVGFDPALHLEARDSRGRVQGKKWKRITLHTREWSRYITQIQKRAGMMRASWVPALASVGGKAPYWVAGKQVKHGDFIDATQSINPSFTATSRANGVTQFARIYQNALKSRAVSVERNVNRLLREARRRAGL